MGGFTTQDQVYYLIWEGYGNLNAGYERIPQVSVLGRNYLAFVGPPEAIYKFADENRMMTFPSLWWPSSRRWCVSTEIDLNDTYVGGSDECIGAILNCPDLEAFPASEDARIDHYTDTINT